MKTVKVNEVAMVNEALIPVEEQAITDAVPTDAEVAVEEFVPVLSLPQNNLEQLVPEDERKFDEPEEEKNEYLEAKRQGLLSPVSGMANIKNTLDGQLYACVHENSKDERTIVFCQRYGNWEFSPKISVAQSDLLMYHMATGANEKTLKARATSISTKICSEYLGKYKGGKILNIADILRVLVRSLELLPVYKSDFDILEDPSMLYHEIMNCIRGKDREFKMPYSFCVERKAYFGLMEEQVDALAQHCGVKRRPFLKKLNEYGFLYRPDSSRGYQTKVRLAATDDAPSSVEWLYCIYNFEYLTGQKRLEEPEKS